MGGLRIFEGGDEGWGWRVGGGWACAGLMGGLGNWGEGRGDEGSVRMVCLEDCLRAGTSRGMFCVYGVRVCWGGMDEVEVLARSKLATTIWIVSK